MSIPRPKDLLDRFYRRRLEVAEGVPAIAAEPVLGEERSEAVRLDREIHQTVRADTQGPLGAALDSLESLMKEVGRDHGHPASGHTDPDEED